MDEDYSNVQGSKTDETTIRKTTIAESEEVTHSAGSKSFKESTPDEVKDRVKETVAKGVAAVAGALKGFADEVEKNRLAESTRNAIEKAGGTAREVISSTTEQVRGLRQPIKEAGESVTDVVGTATDQVKNLKEPLQNAGQAVKDTSRSVARAARDVGKTAKDEIKQTKEHIGSSSGTMGLGESSKDLGASAPSPDLMTSSYNKEPSSSIGGSSFERGSMGGTDVSGGTFGSSSFSGSTSMGMGGSELGSATGPENIGGGTNPVGGNAYPHASNVRGSSFREDSMQGGAAKMGSSDVSEASLKDMPDISKTTLGTQKDIKDKR